MNASIAIGLAFLILTFDSSAQGLKGYHDIINIDNQFERLESNVPEMRSMNLSYFWSADNTEQRFGFIGTNYRRLRIKFLSIIKNESDPAQYFVYGKSNVADNICVLQGTITIKESYYIRHPEAPDGNTGILAGEYKFYEDPKSKHAGAFEGRFVTYWYKDKDGSIRYNDLSSVSAEYNNNQFAGTWTGYQSKSKIIANWGDSRIPLSGDLDVGTSEFGVNEKYQMNGWTTLVNSMKGGNSKEEKAKAIKEEQYIWWKDNPTGTKNK